MPAGSDPELLALAAARLDRDGVPSDHMTVVGGALDGVQLALMAHVRPGDRIAVEDPCYPGVIDLASALGLTVIPMAIDDRGPTPEGLARALRGGAVACAVTPRAQNPYGSAVDAERAEELRAVLAGHPSVLVLEDDHAFDITERRCHSLCEPGRARWAHLRSVSKSLGPDLRLAIMAGDATTVARVEGRRLLAAGWVSHLLQRLVVSLWSDPAQRLRRGRRGDFTPAAAKRSGRRCARGASSRTAARVSTSGSRWLTRTPRSRRSRSVGGACSPATVSGSPAHAASG